MILNNQIWNEVIEAAKASTANTPEWLRAVERGAAEIERARYWSFVEGVLSIRSTTSGELHRVDDQHTCEATRHGKPCKHLAARRLMRRYHERLAQMPAPPASPAPETSDWREKAILIKRDGNALIVDGWAV
ncbi:MAG: hypothetical protein ACREEM_04600 [Blastocatellia bacterium]